MDKRYDDKNFHLIHRTDQDSVVHYRPEMLWIYLIYCVIDIHFHCIDSLSTGNIELHLHLQCNRSVHRILLANPDSNLIHHCNLLIFPLITDDSN